MQNRELFVLPLYLRVFLLYIIQHDIYQYMGYAVTTLDRQLFLIHIMHRYSSLLSSSDY